MANPYICYVCGWKSSVERTKPGQFLCNECLKVWEGGKFYLRTVDMPSSVPLQAPESPVSG